MGKVITLQFSIIILINKTALNFNQCIETNFQTFPNLFFRSTVNSR